MSLDKAFRFDESVCGRCGRTAPAGCICVGIKALEPGERVGYRLRRLDALLDMDAPQSILLNESREDEKWRVDQPRTVRSVNPLILDYPGDPEPEEAEEEFIFSEGFITPVAEGDEEYSAGDELFEEDQKCFKALSDLIGYDATKALEPGQRVFYRQPVYSDNPEDRNPEGEPGQVGHTTPEEYPENIYTVINQHPTEKNRYYIRDSSGTEFAFPEEMLTPYDTPASNEEQKCFKALSDLIGYNVKVWHPQEERFSHELYGESPEVSARNDQDAADNELAGLQRNLRTVYTQFLDFSEDSDEDEDDGIGEKMLSYLNTGSGGALVPPPEFSLKAKKKKKTVQGDGKSQQSLESGDPVLRVPHNEEYDADRQKYNQQELYITDVNQHSGGHRSFGVTGGGPRADAANLFYDTSRKSQQNLEYGDPILLVNPEVDADSQKEIAPTNYVYGRPREGDPLDPVAHIAGSREDQSSRDFITGEPRDILYDTSRRNRTKSITPPRVKMGVMRATAPNRIDLVVEIVAKLFNEQAVQQFLQEMAGGVPPQQGKMFRKGYTRQQLRGMSDEEFVAADRQVAGNTTRAMGIDSQASGTRLPQSTKERQEHEQDTLLTSEERRRRNKSFGARRIDKHLYVPFVKNLRGHLVKAGFTGTMQDAMGRRMCFSAGKRVHCARDERGTHDDKVRQEEAPVPGNLSSGEGTANPVVQGIDVLKEIKFRIQGIASQCSLPPNAVRDVVMFLLEVPDDFLMAFNAELDMRGGEIRAILFEAVSSLAPQPVDQVESGRPVPPTLGKKSVDDRKANPPGFIELVDLRSAHPRGSQEWHKYDEALRNRYLGTGVESARAHTNEYMSDIYHQQEPYDPVVRDDPPPEGQKSIDPELLRNLPPRNLRNLGLDVFQQSREDEKDPTKVTEKTEEDVTDVGAEMRRRRGESESSGSEQKSFPSPDLVLYEMQKNPNPTELERMQMELLMRILNDRNFA